MKKHKKTGLRCARASVSIMLSFLMLPVYTFAGAVVDGARVASARQMTAGATELALNAGLSDYNDVLKSVYGLFAMSGNEEELKENLSEYYYRTVNNTALSEEDEDSRKYIESIGSFFSNPSQADFDNLIRISASDFTAEYVDGAVLANPSVLKNQIIEYMKYTGPVSMGRGFIAKLGAFRDIESQNKAVEARVEYNKSLEKINKHCSTVYTNASAYNRLITEENISDSEKTRRDIANTRELYREATENIIIYKSLSVKLEELKAVIKAQKTKVSDEITIQFQETSDRMEECKNKADESFRKASDVLCSLSENAYKALEYLENAKSSLESLIFSVKDSEEKGENWKNAVSSLADGEVKTMMQSDYDVTVGAMGTDDIAEYLEVTENNIECFRKITEYVTGVKFYGNRICEYTDYSEKYISTLPDYSIEDEEKSVQLAESQINENFLFPSEDIPADYTFQGADYAFYRYLSEIFGSGYVSEADKASAGKFLDTVNSLGKPENSEVKENVKSGLMSKISEKKLEKIKKASETPDDSEEFTLENSSADSESMLENQQKILVNTSGFFRDIGKLAENAAESGMEDLLLTEYITEMFSCHTSDKECDGSVIKDTVPKTITGSVMCEENNPFYKAEAEYILWGNEDMEKNIRYTEALIFGMRFALNNVYAFTDSEIRSVTLTAASAIAGWTGFGIPVVQTVLTMSLALAESASDLNILLRGGAVPVYKSSSTWYMKPSGLINALRDNSDELAKLAAEKTGKAVDDIFSKLEKAADEGADSITEAFSEFADNLTDDAVDSAVNAVDTVIKNTVISVIDSADSGMSQENIEAMINERIDRIDSEGDDICSAAVSAAKKYVKDSSGRIAEAVYARTSVMSTGAREKAEILQKDISEQVENILVSLRDEVKESAEYLCDALKEQAEAGINAAGEYASEYAQDMVTYCITNTSTALTERLNSVEPVHFSGISKASPAKSISLTYKEYLKIFILLNSLSENKERAMLTRTAVIIDINITHGMQNNVINGVKHGSDPDFDISEAYTMLKADASADIGTWFIGSLVPDIYSENQDEKNSGLSKEKNIIYRSVLSY